MHDGTPGRIVHAADLHLGAPLESLGRRIGAEKAEHLRGLARQAFDRLIDTTLAVGADALVLAGDVYDDADREVGAQLRVARGLARLGEAGIPVFLAHGNHDPVVAEYRPAAPLPGNVTVFTPGAVQVHELALRSGESAWIAGVSFAGRRETENLAGRFAGLDAPAGRCIAVLHANLAGTSGHDPYAPCTIDDLGTAPVAYWALGHVHLRQTGELGPGRRWAYPGNLQGRSTKPAECGAKGALVVPLAAEGVGEPEFVACDALRFVRLDVPVGTDADVADALGLVGEQCTRAAEDADGRPLLVRARLVGRAEAHRELQRTDDLLDLAREQLGGTLGEGELLGIEVATAPPVDRDQLLRRGDLLAALLVRVDELRSAPAAELETLLRSEVDHGATLTLLGDLLRAPDTAGQLLDAVERRLVDAFVEDA